jgi:hypothetical protein
MIEAIKINKPFMIKLEQSNKIFESFLENVNLNLISIKLFVDILHIRKSLQI